jgi:hypothetical protein
LRARMLMKGKALEGGGIDRRAKWDRNEQQREQHYRRSHLPSLHPCVAVARIAASIRPLSSFRLAAR